MFEDFLGLLLACIIGVTVLFTPIVLLDKAACSDYGEMTGLKTEHSWLTCYVDVDGEVFTKEEYREFVLGKRIYLENN